MMRSFLQNEVFRAEIRGKENPKLTTWFLDEYVRNIHEIPILREAKAIAKQWENTDILVYPQELIVGSIYSTEVANFHYGDGVRLYRDRVERFIKEHEADADSISKKADLVEEVSYRAPYMQGFDPSLYTKEELASIGSTAASSTWFGGHLAMDYDVILKQGLCGYKEQILQTKAQNLEKQGYYEALLVMLSGFQTLIRRTADICAVLAEKQSDSALKENMETAARVLTQITERPPATFHEALQLVVMVHIGSDADSFGRFDSYLRPFFEADIQEGRMTEEQALDLLLSLVIKIEQQDQIQNMTIGGILPNGSLNYTRLTELMLVATKTMGYKGPNLCMRVHPDMPSQLWASITDCMASGQGLPALYNDEVIVKSLTAGGYPLELARDYCLGGCSQIMFGGRCQFVNDIGMMNIAKIMELTLHNGRDFLHGGEQISPKTGEPDDFADFGAFYHAFLKQLDYFVEMEASINNKDILDRGKKEGYAFRSLFTRGCIESGKGVFEGGALYNNVQMECIGITNAADSLFAIKKMVFEDKKRSLKALVDLLDCDFEGNVGHNECRTELRALSKFGNDCDEVDALRAAVTKHLYDGLRAQKGAFGGRYIPGEVIFTAHEHCGYAVAATPDGRYAQEVLADSAGSSQGLDMHGPTALMNSVQKIPIEDMITSVVLNVKFHRGFFKENSGLIAALFQGHFAGGGEQLQINVCDNEELKQALLFPEKYQNLVVRVGGYSDYFVRLHPRLQEEIILRSSSVM